MQSWSVMIKKRKLTLISKRMLSMVLGLACFSVLVSFSVVSLADTKKSNEWLAGKWVVVASPSSFAPTTWRDPWEWIKIHGKSFTLFPRAAGFPFAPDRCIHPEYSREKVDALTFYKEEKTPLETLGIYRSKVNVVDISCDQEKWGLTTVMRVAKGIIAAGVSNGGYILAVSDRLLSGKRAPVDKNCKRLAEFMDRYKQDRKKLVAAGCWNAGGAMVYAWTWQKNSKQDYSRLLITTHDTVHSVLIQNDLLDALECWNFPTFVPSQHAKRFTPAFADGLIKGLKCQASCKLAGFGPLKATVKWAECFAGKAAFRICKASWKSGKGTHSFKFLVRK